MSAIPKIKCRQCGHKYQIAGPLWLGELHDRELLKKVANSNDPNLGQRNANVIDKAITEIGMPPTYYVVANISKR